MTTEIPISVDKSVSNPELDEMIEKMKNLEKLNEKLQTQTEQLIELQEQQLELQRNTKSEQDNIKTLMRNINANNFSDNNNQQIYDRLKATIDELIKQKKLDDVGIKNIMNNLDEIKKAQKGKNTNSVEIKEKLDSLQESVEEVKKSVKEVQIELDKTKKDLLSKFDTLDKNLVEKLKNLADKQDIEALKSQLDNLESLINSIENLPSNLEDFKNKINLRIDKLESSQIELLNETFNILNQQISQLSEFITTLSFDVSGLGRNEDNLNLQLGQISNEMNSLNTKLGNKATDENINNITKSIEEITKQLTSLQKNLEESVNAQVAAQKISEEVPTMEENKDNISELAELISSSLKNENAGEEINVPESGDNNLRVLDEIQPSLSQTGEVKYIPPSGEGRIKFNENLKIILKKGGSTVDNIDVKDLESFINSNESEGIIQVSNSIPELDNNNLNNLSPLLIVQSNKNQTDTELNFFNENLNNFYQPLFGILNDNNYLENPTQDENNIKQLLYLIKFDYVGLDSVKEQQSSENITETSAVQSSEKIIDKNILDINSKKYKVNVTYYNNLKKDKIKEHLKDSYSKAGAGYYNYNQHFNNSFNHQQLYGGQYVGQYYYPPSQIKQPLHNFIVPLMVFNV